MAVAGVKRVRVNSLDGVSDYVHVEDVARAIVALLQLQQVRYSTYNIATGRATRLGELVQWAAEKYPEFHAEITPDDEADIVQDPGRIDGMWGAYDVSRISAETGWRPRPVREALHAYMDWIAIEGDLGASSGEGPKL
jgi:UDP-glucose 4-epimerase